MEGIKEALGNKLTYLSSFIDLTKAFDTWTACYVFPSFHTCSLWVTDG